MDAARTDTFVGMYVNAFTVDYGPRGRAAVERLLDAGYRAGLLPAPVTAEFIEG
jgi:1,4-dihydroxy-6-naphthoate synthase